MPWGALPSLCAQPHACSSVHSLCGRHASAVSQEAAAAAAAAAGDGAPAASASGGGGEREAMALMQLRLEEQEKRVGELEGLLAEARQAAKAAAQELEMQVGGLAWGVGHCVLCSCALLVSGGMGKRLR